MSVLEMTEINKWVQGLLDQGVIRPSSLLIWCFDYFFDAQTSFAYGSYTLYDFIYLFLNLSSGFVHQFAMEQHQAKNVVQPSIQSFVQSSI